MRGKAFLCLRIRITYGITPAYAGKREYHARIESGEIGSPPPMRGKAFGQTPTKKMVGITPAYAGKRFYRTEFQKRR